jgi:hypothetical protein
MQILEYEKFRCLPSVYAQVVHVPCSPISPVMVALKALPPIHHDQNLYIVQCLPETYRRSGEPLSQCQINFLHLGTANIHAQRGYSQAQLTDPSAESTRCYIRIAKLPGKPQLVEVQVTNSSCSCVGRQISSRCTRAGWRRSSRKDVVNGYRDLCVTELLSPTRQVVGSLSLVSCLKNLGFICRSWGALRVWRYPCIGVCEVLCVL